MAKNLPMDFFTAHKYNISLKTATSSLPRDRFWQLESQPTLTYEVSVSVIVCTNYEILEGHNKNNAKICVLFI